MARKAINLLDSFTILNALEQMRKESTYIAAATSAATTGNSQTAVIWSML